MARGLPTIVLPPSVWEAVTRQAERDGSTRNAALLLLIRRGVGAMRRVEGQRASEKLRASSRRNGKKGGQPTHRPRPPQR